MIFFNSVSCRSASFMGVSVKIAVFLFSLVPTLKKSEFLRN